MDRESKQSRLGAHLRGVSGVGAPRQLGDTEAEHGDDVDVDAPIPEISNRPVHSIRMLRGYIWWHLHTKFWSNSADWAMMIEASCSQVLQLLQYDSNYLHLECPRYSIDFASAASQIHSAARGYGVGARPC